MKGHLDGLEGAYIVGWAVGDDRPNSTVSVTDDAGKVLATGLACIERSDLTGLGLGRSNFAFRIRLPSLGAVSRLHVLADGVEIPNSPLKVGADVFDGHFNANRGFIDGWVAERRVGFEPPMITVCDQDGDVVFKAKSEITAMGGSGNFVAAQFSGAVALRCFGHGELRLTAYANGIKFADCVCDLPLSGNAEVIGADHVSGWLVSPAAPRRMMEIEVYRDGELVTTALCDGPREDVKAVINGATHCGFSVALPTSGPAPSPLDVRTISFRLPGDERELFEGPFVLAGRPALVSAARRLSQLAYAGADSPLTPLEQAVLATSMADTIAKARETDRIVTFGRQIPEPGTSPIRLSIVIPIYRGVEITQACIDSVLRHRSETEDRVVLVNDRSPDAAMEGMLAAYAGLPNVVLLANEQNLGFVKTSNRGLAFCTQGDVVLLNSDTVVFAGGIQELWRVGREHADIGTVTAMSNNATIFSYPHLDLRQVVLDDIGWEDLAAIALDKNRGMALDVPTGHGFCMLIKQEVLRRIGRLDEGFGRGYGEENDLCARAADLGYRNVEAPGALVEHKESISFVGEKSGLLAMNLPKLEKRYPEYTPTIIEVQRRDDLRKSRWALDAERLARSSRTGGFILTIQHALGGGTKQAVGDIEKAAGVTDAKKLDLLCRQDGVIELRSADPIMRAVFLPDEVQDLMTMLSAADIKTVAVHQVLGFPPDFISALSTLIEGRHSLFYAHDFYSACPRVTMIDALGQFCNVAATDVCGRCVEIDGAHDASRLTNLTPAEHRAVFGDLLGRFTHLIAPSSNAAGLVERAFPHLAVEAVPHPEFAPPYPKKPRPGNDVEVVLFGAIGPHKGSGKLVEIAQQARLRYPALSFRVIGYTDRDEELRRIGNVKITGAYEADKLDSLVRDAKGRIALFLSGWPETFSYTLSEAVRLGFIPFVPDIGAPAERVRAAGFGVVFPFPIVAAEVLDILARFGAGKLAFSVGGGSPQAFESNPALALRTRDLLVGPPAAPPAAEDQTRASADVAVAVA